MIKIFRDTVPENLIFSIPDNTARHCPPSFVSHHHTHSDLRVGLSVDFQHELTEHITEKEVTCHTAGEGRGQNSFHPDISLRGENHSLLQGERSREGGLGGRSFTIPRRMKEPRDRRVDPCGAQPRGI